MFKLTLVSTSITWNNLDKNIPLCLSRRLIGMWNHSWLQKQLIEPRHDKTYKMNVRPAKTQISLDIRPVWSESSLYAQRVA